MPSSTVSENDKKTFRYPSSFASSSRNSRSPFLQRTANLPRRTAHRARVSSFESPYLFSLTSLRYCCRSCLSVICETSQRKRRGRPDRDVIGLKNKKQRTTSISRKPYWLEILEPFRFATTYFLSYLTLACFLCSSMYSFSGICAAPSQAAFLAAR